MIKVKHLITKKITKDGPTPYVVYLELSHSGPNAVKGKLTADFGSFKHREEFSIPGTASGLQMARRTKYVGIPCGEKLPAGFELPITLRTVGLRQEDTVTITSSFEDRSNV